MLAVILAASCSPKVVTHISTLRAPLGYAEPITVTEDLPRFRDAQLVGTVEVSDSGFSIDCGYDEVVALAVAEVRKAGGNYLHINVHRRPDWISSCHWIAGTIFYVDEPQLRPAHQEEPMLSAFQPMYIKTETEPEHKLPGWRIAFDVAYSHRTAKIGENTSGGNMSDSEWTEFMRGLMSGVSYGASITGFFNSVYGLGAKFVGNHYSNRGFNADTYYIAPEFMLRVPNRDLSNIWIFSISAGYVGYRESFKSGDTSASSQMVGGIKSTAEVGFDFRIAQGVYMGLKLVSSVGAVRLKTEYGESVMNSLHAIEIGGGIRF